MSYQVLAVKWRPRRFDELVGQTHVVTALVNSLSTDRLHHAYLFSGTRGVGKTTVARILAKAFNCESGVSAEPCGECAACRAIDEGRFVDLIEVDAASRTKVDDTRELLDNVQYMPTRGRFKVYLIDEVHMLSNHSFNALLKTLEEPPPHVKFLFATTDPQKLPVTVLSRCLQFNLKKLPVPLIREQLRKICEAEGVEAEPEGLKLIAKAADGSMRDALSLLDQGIGFGGGKITEAEIKSMLGTIDRSHVLRFVEAIANDDGQAVLAAVDEIDELAPDYGAVLDELMAVLQRIAVAQLVEERDIGEDEATVRDLAKRIPPEDVQLFYQIGLNGRRDIAVCRDERMSFEMTLLRMLAFRLDERDAASAEEARAAGRGRTGDAGPTRAAATEPGQAAARSVVRAKHTPRASSEDRPGEATANTAGAAGGAVETGRALAAGAGTAAGAAGSTAAAAGDGASGPSASGKAFSSGGGDTGAGAGHAPREPAVVDDWPGLIKASGLAGAARNLADHCELAEATPSRIDLVLSNDKTQFNTDRVRSRLQDTLSEHLGRPLTVRITVGAPPRATPAEVRRASEDARMRQAREAIESDPNIRAVQSAFDAVLEPTSIQPARK